MNKSKPTWLYFAVPLVVLLGLYAAAAYIGSTMVYHQPTPEPMTLIKYSVSRFADWIEFDHFYFSLPEEWEAAIMQAVPDFPTMYPIRHYHLLLDHINKPVFYRIFPYYALAAFLGSFIFYKYKDMAIADATPEAKRADVYSRGARLVDPAAFCRRIKNEIDDPAAAVGTNGGALLFSGNRLREHMAIFGASGTGKSQFLLAFLASFLANKSPETRCIIVDRKGEFFAHFGTPEDIIFNPFDARSVRWSLCNELDIPRDLDDIPSDVKAVSKILFPANNKKDPFWEQSAAKAFCSAVAYCIRAGKLTNRELVNFCNQEWGEVVKAFKTLPPELAAGLVIAGNATTGGSILSTLQNVVDMFAACPDGDFSVKDWIRNGSGSLYLSSAGRNDTVFIPILSLFIDLIGREVKELPDSGRGGVKYLFVIDELAAYPAMQTLHFLVAEARSKGVAVIIATQTIQKVLQVYGEKEGRDVLGNTKSKVIFRTIEAQDAGYLSKTIGQTEVQRTSKAENENASTVFGRIDGREGTTMTKQIVTEAAVMASDLMTLETGNAIVLHPNAGETVAKLKFDMFKGEKKGIEFDPVKENTVSAIEYAEQEKKRAADEEARKKEEEEKKRKEAEAEAEKRRAEEEEKRKEEERKMIERLQVPTTPEAEPEREAGKDDYLL